MGRRIKGQGVCRWCRCDHFHPCPEGCGWADGRTKQLCTACVDVEQAWQTLRSARLPNMHRAFFLGYLVGAEDPRLDPTRRANPYKPGGSANYWEYGYRAGGFSAMTLLRARQAGAS